MANEVSLFEQPSLVLPDYISDFFEEEGANITPRMTVPTLSYTGKVWTISANGEKTKLVKRDEEGDEIPLAVMRVVVMDYAKRRGRSYYPGSYSPDQTAAPDCWSDDGEKPDPSIEKPQCSTCAKCPMAVKGSRTNDKGDATYACAQHRMLAVVPAGNLNADPLRLKLAITSDWDKRDQEMQAKGWFAYQQYVDFLTSKGVVNTGAVVTKMRFDPNEAYPKVLFSPDRVLERDEIATLRTAKKEKEEQVQRLLGGSWTVNGVDGVERSETGADGVGPDPEVVAAAKQAEAERLAVEEAKAEAARQEADAIAKAQAENEAAAKAEADTKSSAAADMGFDGDDEPSLVTEKASVNGAAGGDGIPDDIKELMADWG